MHVITARRLQDFWLLEPRAQAPLKAWLRLAKAADWKEPADIKDAFGANVDFVADNRVIFDIGGNKYRLIVHVAYRFGKVPIKFVGAHKEYDAIDPENVS